MPNRKWDANGKFWRIPHTQNQVETLRSLFHGEPIQIDLSLQKSEKTHRDAKPETVEFSTLQAMESELKLKGYSAKTRKGYLGHVRRFLSFFGNDPRTLNEEGIRRYALHLLDAGQAHSTVNQCICALKFLFGQVLKKPTAIDNIPRPKKERKLPKILSRQEVLRFFEAVKNPKHRALLMVVYSSALRVGEAVRLQVEDIDTDRGVIHIRKAKGHKDRYVMLSAVAQQAIEVYCKAFKPTKWLFPGQRKGRHLTERTVQNVVHQVCERANITKPTVVHTPECVKCFETPTPKN
ncbi:MAG: site-specific integrase [Candidatus Latescibacteria bacterium]|nr:site-specific integrase [Candidatus Latescibacterota bacterium]